MRRSRTEELELILQGKKTQPTFKVLWLFDFVVDFGTEILLELHREWGRIESVSVRELTPFRCQRSVKE